MSWWNPFSKDIDYNKAASDAAFVATIRTLILSTPVDEDLLARVKTGEISTEIAFDTHANRIITERLNVYYGFPVDTRTYGDYDTNWAMGEAHKAVRALVQDLYNDKIWANFNKVYTDEATAANPDNLKYSISDMAKDFAGGMWDSAVGLVTGMRNIAVLAAGVLFVVFCGWIYFNAKRKKSLD